MVKKATKRNFPTRMSPKQKQERMEQIADIQKRLLAKEAPLVKLCQEYNLTPAQYYASIPKDQRGIRARNKVQFSEINLKSGKTLFILTDDQSTISNIISTFRS